MSRRKREGTGAGRGTTSRDVLHQILNSMSGLLTPRRVLHVCAGKITSVWLAAQPMGDYFYLYNLKKSHCGTRFSLGQRDESPLLPRRPGRWCRI